MFGDPCVHPRAVAIPSRGSATGGALRGARFIVLSIYLYCIAAGARVGEVATPGSAHLAHFDIAAWACSLVL